MLRSKEQIIRYQFKYLCCLILRDTFTKKKFKLRDIFFRKIFLYKLRTKFRKKVTKFKYFIFNILSTWAYLLANPTTCEITIWPTCQNYFGQITTPSKLPCSKKGKFCKKSMLIWLEDYQVHRHYARLSSKDIYFSDFTIAQTETSINENILENSHLC